MPLSMRRVSSVRFVPHSTVHSATTAEESLAHVHSSSQSTLLDAEIETLFENNEEWVKKMTEVDPHYFLKKSSTHDPTYLYIGCCDARAPADLMLGLEPGELFVHRNIANQVVNTDANGNSVIEYAVNSLKVKHILVCGHYGCGGIKYALESDGCSMIDYWMRNIRDVYRLHADELDNITDSTEKLRRLVELNVAEQVVNLYKTPAVQRSVKASGFPRVHGLVYDIQTGYVTRIAVESVTDPLHRYDHVFMFSKSPTMEDTKH